MKRFFFVCLMSLCCSIATAQTNTLKYVYHQAVVKDANSDEIIEDFGYGNKGIIIYSSKNGAEWISVNLGTTELYSIKVVQTIDDYPIPSLKVEMKKGGVMKNDKCIGTITVFRIFDLDTNELVPVVIRTQVTDANVAFEFEGIIPIID